MISHMKPEEKKYICEKCGKRFGWSHHLQKHEMNVHVRSRPYKCSVSGCNWAFNDLSNRNMHERRVHKLGPPPKRWLSIVPAINGTPNHGIFHTNILWMILRITSKCRDEVWTLWIESGLCKPNVGEIGLSRFIQIPKIRTHDILDEPEDRFEPCRNFCSVCATKYLFNNYLY